MPTYDYQCSQCNLFIEIFLSIKNSGMAQYCQKCNNTLTKKYNSVPTIFNASGFYKTDNRKTK